jgi:hypothetical protein
LVKENLQEDVDYYLRHLEDDNFLIQVSDDYFRIFKPINGTVMYSMALHAALITNRSKYKELKRAPELQIDSIEPALISIIETVSKTIQYSKQSVNVFPAPGDKTVATRGVAAADYVKQNDQGSSGYGPMIAYMNRFNCKNVSDASWGSTIYLNYVPDFNQYDLSTMVDSNNYVDMYKTTMKNNSLIFYSAGDRTPNVANKETGTTVVGAAEPQNKQYDISFDTGVATIPANDTEIARAVQDAIEMFPDGNITNLTVVSSASPEFNSKAGGPRTLADYGNRPLAGTGKPAPGTDNISRNIELAYNRGISFMNSLNAGLKAQGKPEISNYTIQWQISDKGGSKVPGRYAEVQWTKAGTPGKEVGTMANTGTTGNKIDGKQTFNIFMHTFSWQ